MTLLAVPNLGNPDRSLVDRIFRDDVTDAAGHLARALPQDIDHLVSFSVMSRQAHDQAVHLKPPRGISAQLRIDPALQLSQCRGVHGSIVVEPYTACKRLFYVWPLAR